MRYLIFRKNLMEIKGSANSEPASIHTSYEFKTFTPHRLHLIPNGVNKSLTFILWAILYLAIWKRRGKDFEYYLVYDGEKLIHYSIVLPQYYRFPFMGNNDIFVGPCWTAEEYRGKGIFPLVILMITDNYKFRKGYAYGMITEDNIASQRSVIKAGMNIYGYGNRAKGFRGKFLLQEIAS